MVVRWKFDDPITLETWIWEVNPNEGGTPTYKKQMTYTQTTAPDGKTLVFEGADEPQTLTFSGTLLSQSQLDTLVTWYKKRHQIKLTDDLGREFWIYITGFAPKRIRNASQPWKHTYEINATIVDWP